MTADAAEAILGAVDRRQSEMLQLLEDVVAMESPSTAHARQRPVLERFATEFGRLGFTTRLVPGRNTGDHLLCRSPRPARRPFRQLVIGHVDTVWPIGTVEERPPRSDGTTFSGPGAFDMKAGLVQLVAALGTIDDLGWSMPAEPVVFVNSDEEIGSPDSRRWITPLARCARRAYVLEGAFGLDGAIKVGRKGVGRYRVSAKGRAAHAGLDPESGASAILELTHQIQTLFGLNDTEGGVTVNVGTIDGGLRPNVIAPEAGAEVDVRVYTAAQAAAVDRAIRGLTSVNPEVTIEVDGAFGRPPMERTEVTDRMARRAQDLARGLGLELDVAVVGGASDGNLTSQHIPTLDGLGAVGDGAHRLDEHIVLSALPQRAALLAMLLMEPLPAPTEGPSP